MIGPDTVWEVWGLMMPHVQLSNVIELNHRQAVIELALQDSVKRTAMHRFLVADMLKPMMHYLQQNANRCGTWCYGLLLSMTCVMNAGKSCCMSNITRYIEAAHQV